MSGRIVGVWESREGGRLEPIAGSVDPDLLKGAGPELNTTLERWGVRRDPGHRWIASRLAADRWVIAPWPREEPGPAPEGIERRSSERMTLELAGVALRAMSEQAGSRPGSDAGDGGGSGGGTSDGSREHAVISSSRRSNSTTGDRPRDHAVTSSSQSSDLVPGNGHALARYKAMVDSAQDAIIGMTTDGLVLSWNPAAARLFGYEAGEVVGRSVALLVPEDRQCELEGILERLLKGERIDQLETALQTKDGTALDISLTVSPIFGRDGRPDGASTIARDITERKKIEQALMHGALHDPLTDLPNRALFLERLAQSLDRARRDPAYRFALLFLDFDGFKVINDSLGHATGDRLLRQIAGRLRTFVRPGDLVARLGGDEFTLLLDDVTPADMERTAKRVQRGLGQPFLLDDREIYASASIGLALGDAGYHSPEDLLRDADLAMYKAKSIGRARYEVFDPAMRDRAHTRFWMETDMRGALERGEFKLLFQPIVTLATGRVHGFEALLRWAHPERGTISPNEFVPLAEETRMIVPIGAWALREACWYVRRWQRAHPKAGQVRISVNLSAQQLGPNLLAEVQDSLSESSIDPTSLGLEITESVLVDTVESSAALLHQLRDLHVNLHMDDFGTGYSSLGYLPRFPLQAIKIDRSFVHRMGTRRTDLEVVRSIVDLARNLGLGVIAEGVETDSQRDKLLDFGCPLAQGFLFSQPLEPAAAGQLLQTQAS